MGSVFPQKKEEKTTENRHKGSNISKIVFIVSTLQALLRSVFRFSNSSVEVLSNSNCHCLFLAVKKNMRIFVNEIGLFFRFYIFRRGLVIQMMIMIKHVPKHFHHKEDYTGCQAGNHVSALVAETEKRYYGCHFLSPFILSSVSSSTVLHIMST